MSEKLFRTHVGLSYFRQVRDGKNLTDEQMLELHRTIAKIESDITYPEPRKMSGVPPGACAPFEVIPCHRHIAVEIQGEEWVIDKEHKHELALIKEKAQQAKYEVERQAARKKREAKVKKLRDL